MYIVMMIEKKRQVAIAVMDKATSKFSFFCKIYYISKILNDFGLNGILKVTYEFFIKIIPFLIILT